MRAPSRARCPRIAIALVIASGAAMAMAACGDDLPLSSIDAAVRVCASGPTVSGIDVSYYQKEIDWPAVRGAGIEFAFIRVSDGLDHPDTRFADNWAGARAAGVIRGAYQFFRPGRDPIAQADLLLSTMGALAEDDLPPVIDVEATDGKSPAQVAAAVQAWLEHVRDAIGRAPVIYTGKYFWQDMVGRADLSGYPLWIAQWGPTCPDLPVPWRSWSFWQTSATGRIAGITGDVDTDVFNGDREALLAFARTTCGDGRCGPGEDADVCARDCPPCGVLTAEGGTVDDTDTCFVGGGPPATLRAVDGAGFGGHLIWTYTTASAAEGNHGTWALHFAEAGRYRVEAYTATSHAHARQARYAVRHAGVVDTAPLDQAAADGWQVVAELDFDAGGHQWIHLADNTGEPRSAEVQLAFDAVRLTRVGPFTQPPLPPDPEPEEPEGDPTRVALSGGCDAGGAAGPAVAMSALAIRRGRRRRR
jgi:lysozyme